MYHGVETIYDLVPDQDRVPAHFFRDIRRRLDPQVDGEGVFAAPEGWTIIIPRNPVWIFRWGKLDETISAGENKTVSLWCGSDGRWDAWDEDSGIDWENCYAPFVMQTGSIAADKCVGVAIIGSRRTLILHEC